MFAFKRWVQSGSAAVCCALLGFAVAPAAFGAATQAASGQQWAVVSADGTLVRGNGATQAVRVSTGLYLVHFSSNMSRCAYEASSGDPATGGTETPVAVAVSSQSDVPKGIEVQTFDQATGLVADESFHLTTYCGATSDFAVVGTDGTTVRGSHVVSSAHTNTGQYEVVFDHDVHNCVFTATIGSTGEGDFIFLGELSVAGLFHNHNGVFVETTARAGGAADFQFHLAVTCGAKALVGVVNADGTTARGKNVVFSEQLFENLADSGSYEVSFNRNVTACAYTATVGLPGSRGFVSDPVTITTASRLGNPKGVFVFIANANGTPQDEPFHLTVTC